MKDRCVYLVLMWESNNLVHTYQIFPYRCEEKAIEHAYSSTSDYYAIGYKYPFENRNEG